MAAQKYIDRPKPRILFIHVTPLQYTMPFFVGLSEIYDVKFIFTYLQLGSKIYGVDTLAQSQGLDKIKYKVRQRYFHGMSPSGIPLGLIKDLFQEHYDIVVANLGSIEMLFCFIAAKLRRKPIILESGEWSWKGKSSERNLALPFTKFILPRSDAMVVPGSKHREFVISLGARPDGVFVSPNASNIIIKGDDVQKKEQLKKRLGIGTKKVILYVGRLVKQKGVDYLIEAFSKLTKERDDVILIIVGEGESRSELELLSKNLGIGDSIYFTGFVLNRELPPYYLLCDICVMPSITYIQAEVWGRTVNDAMSAGKPIIATDAVGAAFDMVKDGINGFMVPEQDSEALYEAMKAILSNPGLAKRMGEEAKRTVKQGFEYEHMINGFGKAVDAVLCSRYRNG